MDDTKNKYGLFIGFIIIFVVILVSVLFAKLGNTGNAPLTFRALLEWLESYHPWIDNLSIIDLSIQGDWGWFDGFRLFINTLSGIFSFGVYITGAFVNAISYITGLVQFLFVG